MTGFPRTTRRRTVEHRFVDRAPDQLDDGVLYISIPYRSALHRCACGCGAEVVTPLNPHGWTLSFDGRTVSLHPSIGNWNLGCRSRYWIRHDRFEWAPQRRSIPPARSASTGDTNIGSNGRDGRRAVAWPRRLQRAMTLLARRRPGQ
jgi:hypothetical protein